MPTNPLPHILDVLSLDVLCSDELEMKIGSPISNPIVTPVKHDAEDDDCNREAYHHRSDISDDFDLFDGELLRATEDDEVLAHAASRAEPS